MIALAGLLGARFFLPEESSAKGETLWIVVLLVLRARHESRLQTAVARMEQATAEESRLRIADEPDGPREHPLAVDDEDHDEASQAKRRG